MTRPDFEHALVRRASGHLEAVPDEVGSTVQILAPGLGSLVAKGEVVKPGRTLTVCEARAYAAHDGVETLIATMSGTLMALAAREGTAKERRPAPA